MLLGVPGERLSAEGDALSSFSKIGGQPAVMTSERLLFNNSKLRNEILERLRPTCEACGCRLFLLCQCFAPIRDDHNRMLYVFACNRGSCTAPGPSCSIRCLSVDLDEEDPGANDDDVDDAWYASVDSALQPPPPPFSFPAFEFHVDEEPDKDPEIIMTEKEKAIAARLSSGEAVVGDGMTGVAGVTEADLQALEEEVDTKNKPSDIAFEEFRTRLSRCSDQVLRYQRGGVPIFMNPCNTLDLTVPNCAECGTRKVMEMQVLSTVLYFLRVHEFARKSTKATDATDYGVDFGTLTVYTCPKGCANKAGGPVRDEFVFVEPAPTLEGEQPNDGRASFRELLFAPKSGAEQGGSD